jgi:cyclohexadienyl dehydratase
MPIRYLFMLLMAVSTVTLSYVDAGAAPTLERIAADNVVRICIWPEYYGITFRDPRTNELSGLDIDLAKALANDLGVSPRFIESSFPKFGDDLLEGRCDIAMFGVGITPARAARVRFTSPYLRSDIVAVIMKENSPITTWDEIDRPGRVVAVQRGTYMESIMQGRLVQAQLLVVQAPDSREDTLLSGRSDAFMSDVPYTRRINDFLPWAALIYPPHPVSPIDYAYAVAPGDPQWLERVNRFVAAVKQDGRLRHAAHQNRLDSIALCE